MAHMNGFVSGNHFFLDGSRGKEENIWTLKADNFARPTEDIIANWRIHTPAHSSLTILLSLEFLLENEKLETSLLIKQATKTLNFFEVLLVYFHMPCSLSYASSPSPDPWPPLN